jgi:Short C-terminal domain
VTSLVLGALGVVTVVASFAFSLAVLVVTRPPQALPARPPAPAAEPEPENTPATPASREVADESSDPMSRVLRDIERLATLREQGALTEKEFTAQKAKLLVAPASTRTRRPQRTS